MTSSAPVTLSPPRPWAVVRSVATYAGASGLGLVLASVTMMAFALLQGVHCPACDRTTLGSDYARWVTYFHAKDALLLAGALVALLCVPVANRRRYGVAAVVLAALALSLTPR